MELQQRAIAYQSAGSSDERLQLRVCLHLAGRKGPILATAASTTARRPRTTFAGGADFAPSSKVARGRRGAGPATAVIRVTMGLCPCASSLVSRSGTRLRGWRAGILGPRERGSKNRSDLGSFV